MDKALFPPLVLKVASFSLTPLIFFLPLALIFYLFSLWRSLKSEYPQNLIIRYGLQTSLGFVLASLLVYVLRGGDYFFPAGILSLAINAVFLSKLNKWNIWYILEKTTPTAFLSIALLLIGLFLASGRITYLIHGLFLLIAYLLAKLWVGYRSFAWYHSGKAGFLFLAPLGVVLFLESGLDFYLTNGLYWRGLFLGFSSLGVGALIFFRSRKK